MPVVELGQIQVRRGTANTGSGIPQLASGELGWAIDRQELYIGNGSVSDGSPTVGNTRILTYNDVGFIAQGLQGIQYIPGVQGIQGIQGNLGIQGIQGDQGVQGIQGSDGVQGIQGIAPTDIYDILIFEPKPLDTSYPVIFATTANRNLTFDPTKTSAYCQIMATNECVINVKFDGITGIVVTFSNSSTTATITNTVTTVAENTLITVELSGTADTTLAGISILLSFLK